MSICTFSTGSPLINTPNKNEVSRASGISSYRYYFMHDNQFPDLHNSLVKPFVLAMSNCNVRQQYRQNVLFLYLLQT